MKKEEEITKYRSLFVSDLHMGKTSSRHGSKPSVLPLLKFLENKEKKESLEIKQSKFEFFFYPQTIAGDIGRVILGSIILLVMFGTVVLIVIGLAVTAYSNTVGAGLAFMLALVAGLIFVVLPGIGILAIYFLLRRLKIVFSRR